MARVEGSAREIARVPHVTAFMRPGQGGAGAGRGMGRGAGAGRGMGRGAGAGRGMGRGRAARRGLR